MRVDVLNRKTRGEGDKPRARAKMQWLWRDHNHSAKRRGQDLPHLPDTEVLIAVDGTLLPGDHPDTVCLAE